MTVENGSRSGRALGNSMAGACPRCAGSPRKTAAIRWFSPAGRPGCREMASCHPVPAALRGPDLATPRVAGLRTVRAASAQRDLSARRADTGFRRRMRWHTSFTRARPIEPYPRLSHINARGRGTLLWLRPSWHQESRMVRHDSAEPRPSICPRGRLRIAGRTASVPKNSASAGAMVAAAEGL